MRHELTKRLTALEGPPTGITRLIVRDAGNGRYQHMGSGRVYTAEEVARLGNAALVIETNTVRKVDHEH